MNHDTFKLNAIFARAKNNVKYAELTFELGTHSYVDSLVKKGTTPNTFVVNGKEYRACMDESGRYGYIDCRLAKNGGYNADQNYYLYIEAKLDGLKWMGSQLMINDLTKLLEGIEYIYEEKPWYSDYA
ncbi:MAG: hypothetical protein MJ136_05405, partial [Clostridia bacterium]|nr:hypothetical protein [Clostridia bacterium]